MREHDPETDPENAGSGGCQPPYFLQLDSVSLLFFGVSIKMISFPLFFSFCISLH
jgi:hypothetical protein